MQHVYTREDFVQFSENGTIIQVVHSHKKNAETMRNRTGVVCPDSVKSNPQGGFNFTMKVFPEATEQPRAADAPEEKPIYRTIGSETVRSIAVLPEVKIF